jgi:DNA-binding HxlR family transcriptional regulator
MATKRRTYGEACGIPRALDRVGERWALMIVRELVLGPKRFTDIRAGLPHLSADVLAQRLRELEGYGVVRHRKLPPPYAAHVYELTEWGQELESVLIALGRWGARAPEAPEGCGMSLDSYLVSLSTLFDPALAEGFETSIDLQLGEQTFHVVVADCRLHVARGPGAAAATTVTTDPDTLLALVHRRVALADALDGGDLEIQGDRRAFKRFVGLFPLPEPATV